MSLTLLLVAVVCGCSQVEDYPNVTDPNLIDRSWLEDLPCSPPCWYGLVPGQSSQSDLFRVVAELPFIDQENIVQKAITFRGEEEQWLTGNGVWINYKEPSSMTASYFQFSNNVLYDIRIMPNYYINIETIVQKLGEPDYFYYARINPEGKGCEVTFIWTSKLMALSHRDKEKNIFKKDICDLIQDSNQRVPGDLLIHNILLMQEGQMQEYIALSSFQPWAGLRQQE